MRVCGPAGQTFSLWFAFRPGLLLPRAKGQGSARVNPWSGPQDRCTATVSKTPLPRARPSRPALSLPVTVSRRRILRKNPLRPCN